MLPVPSCHGHRHACEREGPLKKPMDRELRAATMDGDHGPWTVDTRYPKVSLFRTSLRIALRLVSLHIHFHADSVEPTPSECIVYGHRGSVESTPSMQPPFRESASSNLSSIIVFTDHALNNVMPLGRTAMFTLGGHFDTRSLTCLEDNTIPSR